MKLTGRQTQQLHAALISAFPTRNALAQMVRFALSENLNTIADGDNLSDTTFRLITWAESQGRLPALFEGSCVQNPDNGELQQVAENLRAYLTAVTEDAPPIPAPAPHSHKGELTNPDVRHERFTYDVFLSHSSVDKPMVRALAERLRADGLRVWLDAWMIQPGDMIGLKIEEGLQRSRTLILCMSQHAFASDWVKLERHTLLFRDPTNSQRRFIPLRLDDCAIPDMIAQFAYVDWRTADEEAYARLRRACQPTPETGKDAGAPVMRAAESENHLDSSPATPVHPAPGVTEKLDIKHTGIPEDSHIPAAVRASSPVSGAATDGEHPLIVDDPIVLGFGPINTLAVTPDGRYLIGGSSDRTVKVWERRSGRCLATLEGHGARVWGVAVTPDGEQIISGSEDSTVKVWERRSGRCLATLEGHGASVWGVAVTPDGEQIISGSDDSTVHIRRLAPLVRWFIADVEVIQRSRRYTNAKVVLVGESGVGKSGLALRLAQNRWQETGSTHGMEVWPLRLDTGHETGDTSGKAEDTQHATRNTHDEIEREVWLWDFAGQPDYRLIHQLYMDETALALLVIDPQRENPFEPLAHWERALALAIGQKHGRQPVKLLVAARCDRGGAMVSDRHVADYCASHAYAGFCKTAAKLDNDSGCVDLKAAIARHIPWDQLPWTATTQLFRTLKETILRIKTDGMALVRVIELRQRLQMLLPDEPFAEGDLRTVIGLLAGQGLVKPLDFGDFVLLQPEQINNYASAVVRIARENRDEIGCVPEGAVLSGNIDFRDMARLDPADEAILLRALVQTFVERSLCLREETQQGTLLVFPSYFRLDRPPLTAFPGVFVTYSFAGPLDEIYTTLIVRLHYTNDFNMDRLWHFAADFKTHTGRRVGLILNKRSDDRAEIQVYFERGIAIDTQVSFIKYIHEHLRKRGQEVTRIRTYVCPQCATVIPSPRVKRRLERSHTTITCDECDETFSLIDLIEEKFASDDFARTVRAMDEEAQINIDRQSLELILVGHALATATEAGQRFMLERNEAWATDGYIELRDNEGTWSEQRIYLKFMIDESLQIKSANRTYAAKWFLPSEELRHRWLHTGCTIMTVARDVGNVIRWHDATAYLRNLLQREREYYAAEHFTALNLERVRKRLFDSA